MRPRCSVFIAASLDGFIARRDGNIDWLHELHPLDKEPNGYDEFIATVDAIVIGRGTYDTVLGFPSWPYGEKRVIVMTHRPPAQPRANEEFFTGAPRDVVSRLAGCQRVYVDGGVVIAQFLAARLIDDLVVSVMPIVLGDGIRLFPGGEGEHRLELEGHRALNSGLVQLSYRVRSVSA
jgi:dihydrofolate reductase